MAGRRFSKRGRKLRGGKQKSVKRSSLTCCFTGGQSDSDDDQVNFRHEPFATITSSQQTPMLDFQSNDPEIHVNSPQAGVSYTANATSSIHHNNVNDDAEKGADQGDIRSDDSYDFTEVSDLDTDDISSLSDSTETGDDLDALALALREAEAEIEDTMAVIQDFAGSIRNRRRRLRGENSAGGYLEDARPSGGKDSSSRPGGVCRQPIENDNSNHHISDDVRDEDTGCHHATAAESAVMPAGGEHLSSKNAGSTGNDPGDVITLPTSSSETNLCCISSTTMTKSISGTGLSEQTSAGNSTKNFDCGDAKPVTMFTSLGPETSISHDENSANDDNHGRLAKPSKTGDCTSTGKPENLSLCAFEPVVNHHQRNEAAGVTSSTNTLRVRYWQQHTDVDAGDEENVGRTTRQTNGVVSFTSDDVQSRCDSVSMHRDSWSCGHGHRDMSVSVTRHQLQSPSLYSQKLGPSAELAFKSVPEIRDQQGADETNMAALSSPSHPLGSRPPQIRPSLVRNDDGKWRYKTVTLSFPSRPFFSVDVGPEFVLTMDGPKYLAAQDSTVPMIAGTGSEREQRATLKSTNPHTCTDQVQGCTGDSLDASPNESLEKQAPSNQSSTQTGNADDQIEKTTRIEYLETLAIGVEWGRYSVGVEITNEGAPIEIDGAASAIKAVGSLVFGFLNASRKSFKKRFSFL